MNPHQLDVTYHLLSNAQPNLFANTSCDFTNRITPPLVIPHGESWEMGLKEFSVVNTLQSIPRDLTFEVESTGAIPNASKVTIPKGFYTATTLLTKLNKDAHGLYHFEYERHNKHISIMKVKTGQGITLTLEPMLANVLGFQDRMMSSEHKAKWALNLKSFCFNLIVYCDLVNESNIGGQREKILRVIPFNGGKYLDVVHREFQHVDYIPLSVHSIRDIRIQFMTDYGELLPLENGRAYVKLHFRKKQF